MSNAVHLQYGTVCQRGSVFTLRHGGRQQDVLSARPGLVQTVQYDAQILLKTQIQNPEKTQETVQEKKKTLTSFTLVKV